MTSTAANTKIFSQRNPLPCNRAILEKDPYIELKVPVRKDVLIIDSGEEGFDGFQVELLKWMMLSRKLLKHIEYPHLFRCGI